MTDDPFQPLPAEAPPEPAPPQHPLALTLTSLIQLGADTSPRSMQTALGASEIGYACPRRLAYKLSGVPPVNFPDPMPSLLGIGLHEVFRELFRRLDGGSTRFMTETYVQYRGIVGQLDLYDRYLRTLFDWKTCSKSRLNGYRKDGSPQHYRVQTNTYAAALIEDGMPVEQVAVVYLPRDGALSAMHVDVNPPDRKAVDVAIDRVDALRGKSPQNVTAVPDRWCGYCAHYNPAAKDLALACPGTNGKEMP